MELPLLLADDLEQLNSSVQVDLAGLAESLDLALDGRQIAFQREPGRIAEQMPALQTPLRHDFQFRAAVRAMSSSSSRVPHST